MKRRSFLGLVSKIAAVSGLSGNAIASTIESQVADTSIPLTLTVPNDGEVVAYFDVWWKFPEFKTTISRSNKSLKEYKNLVEYDIEHKQEIYMAESYNRLADYIQASGYVPPRFLCSRIEYGCDHGQYDHNGEVKDQLLQDTLQIAHYRAFHKCGGPFGSTEGCGLQNYTPYTESEPLRGYPYLKKGDFRAKFLAYSTGRPTKLSDILAAISGLPATAGLVNLEVTTVREVQERASIKLAGMQ
jgi:hypothetical protein